MLPNEVWGDTTDKERDYNKSAVNATADWDLNDQLAVFSRHLITLPVGLQINHVNATIN